QPLRSAFGKPLHINSGYRCQALNKALKGAMNSQHTKGQAADVASDNPFELAELVMKKKLPFDQMILYKTFIHISHMHPGPQRGVVLYDEGYEGERMKFH
ncbi:MAG: D-Ala-D-Ala carboxypeptidase family metallohydrolase, partial [Candidatus Cryptobacteroides sp.]